MTKMDAGIISQTDWTTLDEANKADGHYTSRYPEFYRAALEAQAQAEIDHSEAINAWLDCPDWQGSRMRGLRQAIVATEERWLDCRAAVNVLYTHWQNLIRRAAQECTCIESETGNRCAACIADIRLHDPAYEPNIQTLLAE